MSWRVRRADVDFFVGNLWKDIRPFPQVYQDATFSKDCFTEHAAQMEAAILFLLRDRVGPECFPTPLSVKDSVLIMDRIRGARLFDLIRHLKNIEFDRRDGVAEAAVGHLIQRARARLARVQLQLRGVGPIFSTQPYPLESKLRGLLELFIRIMDLREASEGWTRNLEDFADYWESNCSMVPFRDATTKNMIVAESRLAVPSKFDDVETAQRRVAAHILDTEDPEFWTRVPIIDIDFSSTIHLTSIEDDPISLHCHEWTFGSCPIEASNFVLDPSLGTPDAYRCAATFVVRYLRFGGRKLAYRLINAQGSRIRFAYDDPLFYFNRLPEICEQLSPRFCADFAPLLETIADIAREGNNPSPADAAEMSVDHLRKYYPALQTTYWQQNPYQP